MNSADVLDAIKAKLTSMLGERVHITANHGRRKRSSLDGVLEGTYKSLFTVLIPGTPDTRMSFTYCDVLTRAVVIKPLERDRENPAEADTVIA